ncbi:MAG: hypothetical protein QM784_18600 [Polyangiaceae bacterium]
MGAYELAYGEAKRANEIDPNRADAWTLALVLADLLDEREAFDTLLSNPPNDLRSLDPETLTAWEALLERHLGDLAAPPSTAGDPRANDRSGVPTMK